MAQILSWEQNNKTEKTFQYQSKIRRDKTLERIKKSRNQLLPKLAAQARTIWTTVRTPAQIFFWKQRLDQITVEMASAAKLLLCLLSLTSSNFCCIILVSFFLTTRVCQKTKNISDHLALLVCFVTMISKNCPKKLDHSNQNWVTAATF